MPPVLIPRRPEKSRPLFRLLVRKDQANLDPDLRERLKSFFDHNKLPARQRPPIKRRSYVSTGLCPGRAASARCP